jgi:hypothetical protein
MWLAMLPSAAALIGCGVFFATQDIGHGRRVRDRRELLLRPAQCNRLSAEDVLVPALSRAQPDAGDEIDEFTESPDVEAGPSEGLGEHSAQTRVVDLDEIHRVVDEFAEARLLGPLLEVLPPGFGWDPEHAFGGVFVAGFEQLPGRVTGEASRLRVRPSGRRGVPRMRPQRT